MLMKFNGVKLTGKKGGVAVAYEYGKLRGRIIEKFGTSGAFAKAFPMSERTLSLKMNSKRSWSQKQMARACELLEIAQHEMSDYFFTQKV